MRPNSTEPLCFDEFFTGFPNSLRYRQIVPFSFMTYLADECCVLTRLLQSAAQRAQRSERRSQMWERERERRSQKRQTHFSFLRSQSLKVTE